MLLLSMCSLPFAVSHVSLTLSPLQPLKPKEGRFLPAAAALGGLLFMAPEGHLPAQHDVLRLDPSLATLRLQQGYITCQPKPDVSVTCDILCAIWGVQGGVMACD